MVRRKILVNRQENQVVVKEAGVREVPFGHLVHSDPAPSHCGDSSLPQEEVRVRHGVKKERVNPGADSLAQLLEEGCDTSDILETILQEEKIGAPAVSDACYIRVA